LFNEQGFDPDHIEKQLAHKEKDKIRDAYNHASYLEQRRALMQAWADHLNELRIQTA
jgi:integrase